MKIEDNVTMMDKGFPIKGIVLTAGDMVKIHSYYRLAAIQEYIYENFNVSLEDAKRIAEEAENLRSNVESEEEIYIEEAATKLGIKLA